MTMTDIDMWIGKTLFVPPIIRFCQITRQTQYAASRMFWFFAALDGLYHADTLVARLLFGGMSLFMLVMAATRPDEPASSMLFFRMLAVAFLIMDIFTGITASRWAGIEFWILVLAAEYATTIRTIPPLEDKKTRVASAGAGTP